MPADLLSTNLEALRRAPDKSGPGLIARIKAGGTAPDIAPAPWPALPDGPLVFLVGAASPASVLAALREGRRLILWERSAPVLRAFLAAEDWSAALRTGQLRLACDLDLLTLVLPPGTPTVLHPVLGPKYTRELAWLGPKPARRALLVDGGLLIEELGRSLAAEGFGVWTWEIARLPPEELTRIAVGLQAELIVAVNHHVGLAEAVEQLASRLPAIRLKVWEIDPAIDPIRPPQRPVPRTTIHTWRKANVPVFRAAGYACDHLPLASHPEWRQPVELTPEEHAEFDAPVTFVGRSMILEARQFQRELLQRIAQARSAAGKDPTQAAALLDQVLAAQRATPEVWRVPELLRERIPELPPVARDRREADPVMLAGEIAAAEFRLTIVANLGRYGAHVWGDEGWRGLDRHGVRWRGPAGHRHQLPRIYSNGGVHVDIGRLYQTDIVTLRVFDVIACGGFVIAHHNADLEELFVLGEEIESWRTLAELRAKVEHYLAHPDERRRIAERGRTRVLRDHTVQQRVAMMLGG